MVAGAVLTNGSSVLEVGAALVGLTGSIGVAYAVFRSASEQRLREIDKQLIDSQTALLAQVEAEAARERTLRVAAELAANTYRESLTQKAAVDHVAEILSKAVQASKDAHDMHTMLLKDIVAQLKGQRGSLG